MSLVFQKNQERPLSDLGATSPLLVFALNWMNKPKAGLLNKLTGKMYDADLDLSCVMYDENDDRTDCIWYAQLTSKCGSVRHHGDDTTGWHDGDDEVIMMDLNQLPAEVKSVFFVISSFSGDSFTHVNNASWRLFDGHDKRELGHYNISPNDKSKAKIVMRLQKKLADGLTAWNITALDEIATGQNIQEIFPEIRSLLEA